jgi:hypothetical protein
MATVTFVHDGKIVKKIKAKKNAKLVQLRINPKKNSPRPASRAENGWTQE